jgi:hypothetical protein
MGHFKNKKNAELGRHFGYQFVVGDSWTSKVPVTASQKPLVH